MDNSLERAVNLLQKYWGYDSFRPMQAEIIESVLSGNDTLGLMATGGGKSLTFQVPAMMFDGITLVITPLISLMKDQVDNLLSRGIRAYALHNALTRSEQNIILDKCEHGRTKLLYLSPEKLQNKRFIDEIKYLPIKLIVVDEAHCISQWGYDFRPSYLKIGTLRKVFKDATVLALTASATPKVVEDIKTQLGFRSSSATFRLSFDRKNLSYVVRLCDFKDAELENVLSNTQGTGIVYVRSRKRTKIVAEQLCRAGISAEAYHAGLTVEDKNARQNRWKEGLTRIMVATTAFGMGIDKPDVRIVVHYDPPSSLEEYYQEAGRVGRDGNSSFCVSLVSASTDKAILSRRLTDAFPSKEYIRDIYDKLCVFLNIAMGEGFERVYEFNLALFCQRYNLQAVPADSALKILSRAGYIEYIEETASRSRLMVVMTRQQLYDLTLSPETDRVFQYVLRTYPGLFADYVVISEPVIASSLGLTEQTVYENLQLLSRMHVIHHIPHRKTPYVMLNTQRQEGRHLIIPKEAYELRRDQMKVRIDAMKNFLFDSSQCRVSTMLRYFGEDNKDECGKCDVCRAKRKTRKTDGLQSEGVEERVLYILKNQNCAVSISVLCHYLGIKQSELIPTLRNMIDNGQLILDPMNQAITLP